jgi:hypothetical protein
MRAAAKGFGVLGFPDDGDALLLVFQCPDVPITRFSDHLMPSRQIRNSNLLLILA